MAQFYTLLTTIGQAKLANAVALGETIEITHLAVGDGGGSMPTPDSDREALVNEVRRAQINLSDVDPENPNWIVLEQVIPPDVGGWTIREIGVFDTAGDLIAYGNYPETYKPTLDEGSGRTQTVRMVLQVSDTAAVTLKVDPAVVLATRQYADQKAEATAQEAAQALQEHEEGRDHPAATTTKQGMLQLATSEQTREGTATNRASHPAGVKAAIDEHVEKEVAHGAQQIGLSSESGGIAGAENVQHALELLSENKMNEEAGYGRGGQRWKDVTSERSNNTIYTNTTGRIISVYVFLTTGSSAVHDAAQVSKNGNDWVAVGFRSSQGGVPNNFQVPDGHQYRLVSGGIITWSELR
ncbi:phage tail protein [Halomonas sp. BC04]|uniref:phage tail protein n=1 Tax=Halomonas sp. BC04 TaxID=1403540 RepID=UPI0003ED811F|nr:phage tail protein [Halomonas sp. BC04]EWH00547.1 phage tail protein [Halomonas sp. BC04]